MTIITKGMGAILKAAKKSKKTGASPEWTKMRKKLSFVGSLRPLKSKKLTIDKGALRISEINKKLKRTPGKAKIFKSDNQPSNIRQDVAEDYAQEVADIYAGK